MDERERQRIEFEERNEKNKVWHKRLKRFYIGLYAPWVVVYFWYFFNSLSALWWFSQPRRPMSYSSLSTLWNKYGGISVF